MQNTNLIREIVKYIQLSTMEAKEKALWMLLLPEMAEEELQKLKKCLEKEVNAITDLYLKTLSEQQQNA